MAYRGAKIRRMGITGGPETSSAKENGSQAIGNSIWRTERQEFGEEICWLSHWLDAFQYPDMTFALDRKFCHSFPTELGNMGGGVGLERKDHESSLGHATLEMTEGHLNLHEQK